ncbi:MAG: acyltransferase [Rhodocyclaceae bacterium]|nr:acyltransferase [Rhodocyclaceae bacterium]
MANAPIDRRLSDLLDYFRWFSAFLVVLSHSRTIVFVPWGDVEHPGLVARAFYFLSGFGHYGVLMFFAISGFLIGGTAWQRMEAGRFSFRDYLLNRVSRIYIVLVPALFLIWALDATGIAWLNGTGIYTQGYSMGALSSDTRERLGWSVLAQNLLMLQNITVPPFGTARPLWTLNWEWWSYMAAPLVLGFVLRFPGPRARLGAALAAAAVLVAAGLNYVLLWHLGILLALIRFRSLPAFAAGAALFLAVPVATRANWLDTDLPAEILFMAGFVLLLSQWRHRGDGGFRLPHAALAGFSYSLYVLHTPLLAFAMAALQTWFGIPRLLQPQGINVLVYLGILGFVYLAAFLFAQLTERHTSALRDRLRRLVPPPSR